MFFIFWLNNLFISAVPRLNCSRCHSSNQCLFVCWNRFLDGRNVDDGNPAWSCRKPTGLWWYVLCNDYIVFKRRCIIQTIKANTTLFVLRSQGDIVTAFLSQLYETKNSVYNDNSGQNIYENLEPVSYINISGNPWIKQSTLCLPPKNQHITQRVFFCVVMVGKQAKKGHNSFQLHKGWSWNRVHPLLHHKSQIWPVTILSRPSTEIQFDQESQLHQTLQTLMYNIFRFFLHNCNFPTAIMK